MRTRKAWAAAALLPLLLASCGGKEEAGPALADSLEEAKAIAARNGSMILLEFFSRT